jgi:hypothetical protein
LVSHIRGRLRVFENRVLRRIFVPKWDEALGIFWNNARLLK